MRRRLAAWGVTPSGPGWRTPSSELMPGTRQGLPVMLKIALVEEEVRGAALLQWWGGRGAARVLLRDEAATLMERATGPRELAALAASGQDATATDILVRTTLALHDHPAPSSRDDVQLVPLRDWFRDLLATNSDDPLLQRTAELAERLLSGTTAPEIVVLHGDIHHGNVLDFGDRWAAIDPKALLGHRGFDFANILCNPTETAALDNLAARLHAISRQADIDPVILAEWTIAWCGLSLAWAQGDATPTWHSRTARAVAELLWARLDAGEKSSGTFSIEA
ncbi:3'-kinase [Cryobacterium lactosi]|uniref:3'-kinase n=1 Tax=Cryobacterium lactosi TaxID=1259202 RepID=A0A4R9BJ22_9MICO|nr:aminoglycoside phosphotransferase family protein [Cryobacterium lactosi]TFD84367.1 3'-kinase [Cryobacterium lactosi]